MKTSAIATFVDTSYLIAMLDGRDSHHFEALDLSLELTANNRTMLTTDAVLIELANYFRRGRLRERAIAWIEAIRKDKDWEVLALDRGLVLAGEERYRRYSDKEWSLTDCISMEVMKHRGIAEVATNDRHFEQAGFHKLL